MKALEIYTDGACRGNPGAGGWGVYLLYKNEKKEFYGGKLNTTNNQMELTAAIEGLKVLKEPCKVKLYTDSKYVMDGINSWIANWKKNNWKTASKKDVKNKDLWIELDAETCKHEIEWIWVKGHSGNIGNEKADALANMGIDNLDV
ncbi:ribonuclease HI [SAR86 cluster bacterium]|jgi:ribonuclease HI|nr:ribonuclease HI [Gammaproteobacteria bacterium]URQ71704.1 ribonuclease HI [SAR86 cluster bacterium]|tara:strand:- start:1590 stop:2027 length:438 start_codon:yes stop_codon:yes gene_type:complete